MDVATVEHQKLLVKAISGTLKVYKTDVAVSNIDMGQSGMVVRYAVKASDRITAKFLTDQMTDASFTDKLAHQLIRDGVVPKTFAAYNLVVAAPITKAVEVRNASQTMAVAHASAAHALAAPARTKAISNRNAKPALPIKMKLVAAGLGFACLLSLSAGAAIKLARKRSDAPAASEELAPFAIKSELVTPMGISMDDDDEFEDGPPLV